MTCSVMKSVAKMTDEVFECCLSSTKKFNYCLSKRLALVVLFIVFTDYSCYTVGILVLCLQCFNSVG